jgi:hypothetical protein
MTYRDKLISIRDRLLIEFRWRRSGLQELCGERGHEWVTDVKDREEYEYCEICGKERDNE